MLFSKSIAKCQQKKVQAHYYNYPKKYTFAAGKAYTTSSCRIPQVLIEARVDG